MSDGRRTFRRPNRRPNAASRGLAAYIRLARPKQWVKNVLVIAAPGAAGVLGDSTALFRTVIAFVCFCLAASGTYYINDALDVEADRRHPTKRFRPIAAGEISVRSRDRRAASGSLVASIGLSFAARWQLALVVGGYLVLTLLYSLWLKHEAVLDLACVASGSCCARSPAVSRSGRDLAVVPHRRGFGVAVHGHRQAPRRAGRARRRRGRAPALARHVLHGVPQLRARGRRRASRSSRTACGRSRIVVSGALTTTATAGNAVWFQLSIVPFVLGILRYALLARAGRRRRARRARALRPGAARPRRVWAVLFAIAVRSG